MLTRQQKDDLCARIARSEGWGNVEQPGLAGWVIGMPPADAALQSKVIATDARGDWYRVPDYTVDGTALHRCIRKWDEEGMLSFMRELQAELRLEDRIPGWTLMAHMLGARLEAWAVAYDRAIPTSTY